MARPYEKPTNKPSKPSKPIIKEKPIKGRRIIVPMPIDDKIIRKMPITEKQLGQIKKMYKLK